MERKKNPITVIVDIIYSLKITELNLATGLRADVLLGRNDKAVLS